MLIYRLCTHMMFLLINIQFDLNTEYYEIMIRSKSAMTTSTVNVSDTPLVAPVVVSFGTVVHVALPVLLIVVACLIATIIFLLVTLKKRKTTNNDDNGKYNGGIYHYDVSIFPIK